ncbi:AAA family ATPase [Paenibacillus sp. LMG 31461]|uniref:AAA family ATPase n=1 Tax=Paenibacillus plantarum TaxID=2654975 RepID=A0ABX1X462_9BACL|nr:AAA family ATPase [Paenibacillus plantarum]NOU63208.1 AAA family ATPase [Paenibacillus plantarum]
MARSTIMLAAAGSGKTYYIAKHLNPTSKNLIITYTKQNVENLKREIKIIHGELPKNTQVLTFTSFVYRWLLKPFEPILTIGDRTALITTGVEIKKEPEPQRINGKINHKYRKQDDYRHYITNQKYYPSRISSLVLAQSKEVKKIIIQRLFKFCDQLYFDELQDFMGKDFDLLSMLIKERNVKVFAVGDFHQHSVSKSNFTTSKPFTRGKDYISKDQYKLLFKGTDIDENTLIKSRRVPREICDFISTKLGIHIQSSSIVKGHFELLEENSRITEVIEDINVTKLFFRDSRKYNCLPTINWGYSKGDTYQKTCIILTKTFESLFEENFSCDHLTPAQINPLYVAITRVTNELYFIKEKDFKKHKKKYAVL